MNEKNPDYIPNTVLKWDDPVSFVKGAGSVVRRAWRSLGIQTISDLILTLPRRYDDFSCIMPIHQTEAGQVYTVKGRVKQCRKLNTFRKRIKVYKVVIDDGTGAISANFFNQPWLLEKVKPDMEIFLSGKVKFDRKYGRHMSHPILEMEDSQIATGKISPVYGLSGTLAQKTYRRLMQFVLDHVAWPKEAFSKDFLDHYQLVDFSEAAQCVHTPQSSEDMELGRRRFAFDELIGFHFLLKQVKEKGDRKSVV